MVNEKMLKKQTGTSKKIILKGGMGEKVCETAASHGKSAIVAGVVEEGPKRIIVEPLGLTYDEKELLIR